MFKFEDVALMRVGEELLPISDEQYLKIITEQEPDFSAQVCEGFKLEDIDELAFHRLIETYSLKQGNNNIFTLSREQVLKDFELIENGKLTYAALILLGKKEIIKKILPQSAVFFEYRNADGKILFTINYNQSRWFSTRSYVRQFTNGKQYSS